MLICVCVCVYAYVKNTHAYITNALIYNIRLPIYLHTAFLSTCVSIPTTFTMLLFQRKFLYASMICVWPCYLHVSASLLHDLRVAMLSTCVSIPTAFALLLFLQKFSYLCLHLIHAFGI